MLNKVLGDFRTIFVKVLRVLFAYVTYILITYQVQMLTLEHLQIPSHCNTYLVSMNVQQISFIEIYLVSKMARNFRMFIHLKRLM